MTCRMLSIPATHVRGPDQFLGLLQSIKACFTDKSRSKEHGWQTAVKRLNAIKNIITYSGLHMYDTDDGNSCKIVDTLLELRALRGLLTGDESDYRSTALMPNLSLIYLHMKCIDEGTFKATKGGMMQFASIHPPIRRQVWNLARNRWNGDFLHAGLVDVVEAATAICTDPPITLPAITDPGVESVPEDNGPPPSSLMMLPQLKLAHMVHIEGSDWPFKTDYVPLRAEALRGWTGWALHQTDYFHNQKDPLWGRDFTEFPLNPCSHTRLTHLVSHQVAPEFEDTQHFVTQLSAQESCRTNIVRSAGRARGSLPVAYTQDEARNIFWSDLYDQRIILAGHSSS